jgi:hypothetical protein|tara:strand:- start:1451 stop:1933 length:483 start_codon:yes stop_codon:yes gene_type:complete
MSHLDFLQTVANNDVKGLREAEKNYGSSWKKRGGVGAFMMLARKWDRIEQQVQKSGSLASAFDILSHARADTRPEGIRDDIRDLRRYLLLVEAELDFLDWEQRQRESKREAQRMVPRARTTTEHPAPFGYEDTEDDYAPTGKDDMVVEVTGESLGMKSES